MAENDKKCPVGQHSAVEVRLGSVEKACYDHEELLRAGLERFHKIDKRLMLQTWALVLLIVAVLGTEAANGGFWGALVKMIGGAP